MCRVYHHILVASALLTTSYSYGAFYVKGDVKGSNVRWDNVTINSEKMVPSQWGVPPALRSVNAWSAGALASAPPSSIVLKGGSGNEVSGEIPIQITGIQYNTMGIDFTSSVSSFGGCGNADAVTSSVVSVDGRVGCISQTKLSTEAPSAPFVLFRPIFSLNEDEIVAALSGKSQGIYSASVPITARYYYENTSGISTYRNISDVMIFTFNYDPIQLENITVLGDGVMEPNYDTSARVISSNTTFEITANGYFMNGLVLTMPTQTYQMSNTLSPGNTIPYSINCMECSAQMLVREGTLLKQETTIAEGSGGTAINFNLRFNYYVDGESLVSGTYQDSVTIMLEAGI
ncbi:hypothetical protein HN008_20295 [Vibrio parahaemolyticus]|nr:hypothetical protein Vp2S01_A0776 [Vibrio parahaemolyticus]MBE4098862.1 hypothetical protein [Vibrio parahaemolyticus]MBE4134075.1 hypothetical protein [Vibrio parahaemolyticus]MBX5339091.1 hypothetical protein [Vibrio parahaemolyticus]OOQ62446.1 hypothetical protein BSR59_24840 [Vibrio parahaemolyticus]